MLVALKQKLTNASIIKQHNYYEQVNGYQRMKDISDVSGLLFRF